MKTAREIIAVAVRSGRACEEEYPCSFCSWSPDEMTKNFDETGCDWIADAILAALAAEGFSIVETGRDPVTIEPVELGDEIDPAGRIRAALSRSTGEGKIK